MLYRGMDRTQLDTAYNNTAAVPQRDAIVGANDIFVRQRRSGQYYTTRDHGCGFS